MRGKVIVAFLCALGLAAAVDQMQRPPGNRSWHGYVLGVPYDFRPPSVDRVKDNVWNPDNPSVLAPMNFGIGWTLNLYPVFHPRVTDGF